MRGHYAVGFRQVVRREKKGEEPRMDTNGHEKDKTVITTKNTKNTKYGNPVTPPHEKRHSWSIRVHSWFYYLPFRVFRVFRGFLPPTSGNARHNCRAGAPKRASHALLSTFSSLFSTHHILSHSLSLASLSIITLRILTMSTVSFGGMGTIRSLKNLRMTSTWFSK